MTQFLIQVSWWMPLYGFIGAVITLPWAVGAIRRTGPRPAAYLNVLMTILACIHGLFIVQGIWNEGPQELVVPWLQVADLNLSFTFDLSILNVGAMELVTGLSLLAQIFALGYMEKDWGLARFFALMGFFEGAMSGIVLSGSFFMAYFLLELLTLSTYLLVGFWYAQPLVVTAARDAFLTKRVGDVLLLMGVVALSVMAGSLNYDDLYQWAATAHLSPTIATLLGLALIAGPTGKCAQVPLHLWLDEAMEGPNPASILRNSAVVTCGAYVLIKLQPIVLLSPIVLNTLVAIGSITAIGASLVALAQIDIKRTLSYSTSAYLGLVFIAVGTGWPGVAMILLCTHAIAKALLYMSVGSVILTTNSQDLTELGGLWSRMPATGVAFAVGAVGMTGVLPLGCFWGLRLGIDFFWNDHPVLIGIYLLVNCLTALNLTRVFRLVFLGEVQPKTRRAPEAAWPMALPMVVLTVFTLLLPLVMWRIYLLPSWEYINPPAVVVLISSGLIGFAIGAAVGLKRSWTRFIQRPLRLAQDVLAHDFYTERLYSVTIVFLVNLLSRMSSWFDRYIVDGLVNLFGLTSIFAGEGLKYSISGKYQAYVLTIVLSVGVLAALFTWSLW